MKPRVRGFMSKVLVRRRYWRAKDVHGAEQQGSSLPHPFVDTE